MAVSLALHALAVATLLATERMTDEHRRRDGAAADPLVLAALPVSVPELAPTSPLPVSLAAVIARDGGGGHRQARPRGVHAAMIARAIPARAKPGAPPPWAGLAPVAPSAQPAVDNAVSAAAADVAVNVNVNVNVNVDLATEMPPVEAPDSARDDVVGARAAAAVLGPSGVAPASGGTANRGPESGEGADRALFGAGSGWTGGTRKRRRPLELFARVIGGGIPNGAPTAGKRPFVSLKEATALRTHDFFPRLPAAAWTERHPYGVVIDLCVSEDGRVTEAMLLSAQSPRFDPLVLEAVRGWHYRPRLVDGQPAPFCHEVIIRYDVP